MGKKKVEKARQPESLPVLLRDHLLCELKLCEMKI
ncbi:hypothetical protein FE394_01035 [Xenorhabdus sp. Reich]|uniref:Transposase n=1 Tax=Xenorhabdus littoralis TaxID=2582835 RepID=A0ABU4SGP7_9GAMM|nr:hypothetical protein [Xenorhabdus sp. Reich]